MRLKFRELSGRFDLVDALGVDQGAGFFINEGRKFLDRLHETQKSWGTVFRFVNVGFYSAQFPHCRAIKEVYAATTTARWQLEKKNIQDLINEFLLGNPSTRETGIPLYYSPCITRYIPESATPLSIESFAGWVEIPSGNAHEYNAILLSIPASEKITIQVNGLFYSSELINDTDENYWTAVHPMLLYMAAMRMVEVTNRNTQGVKDWEASIEADLKTIGYDLVEEIIAEANEMEG